MLKALKAFDKVALLQSDGSNWDTWYSQAEKVASSIGYKDYLTWNPHVLIIAQEGETVRYATDKDQQKDNDLLNAMIG